MSCEMQNYETPAWVVNALLEHHRPVDSYMILEPCAGNGMMINALRYHLWNSIYTGVEIREEEKGALQCQADKVHICDFLTWQPDEQFDLIITNPPFPSPSRWLNAPWR